MHVRVAGTEKVPEEPHGSGARRGAGGARVGRRDVGLGRRRGVRGGSRALGESRGVVGRRPRRRVGRGDGWVCELVYSPMYYFRTPVPPSLILLPVHCRGCAAGTILLASVRHGNADSGRRTFADHSSWCRTGGECCSSAVVAADFR